MLGLWGGRGVDLTRVTLASFPVCSLRGKFLPFASMCQEVSQACWASHHRCLWGVCASYHILLAVQLHTNIGPTLRSQRNPSAPRPRKHRACNKPYAFTPRHQPAVSLEMFSVSMLRPRREESTVIALSSALACDLWPWRVHVHHVTTWGYRLALCPKAEGLWAASHVFYTPGGRRAYVLVSGSPNGCFIPHWESSTSFQRSGPLLGHSRNCGHRTSGTFLFLQHKVTSRQGYGPLAWVELPTYWFPNLIEN